MENKSDEAAEEDYRSRLKIIRDFAEIGGFVDTHKEYSERASALGRNVLHEELGRFGPWSGEIYRLDDETRDRLIAHSRQDIASIHSLATYAMRRSDEAFRRGQLNARLLRYALFLLIFNAIACSLLLFGH